MRVLPVLVFLILMILIKKVSHSHSFREIIVRDGEKTICPANLLFRLC
jgi:hypothetical protein